MFKYSVSSISMASAPPIVPTNYAMVAEIEAVYERLLP
jgi:hypothetical protein